MGLTREEFEELKAKDKRWVTNLGRTAKLHDAGYGVLEIAKTLGKPESSVRRWFQIIEEARKNGYELDNK